jgi:hypothetical protein
MSLSFEVFDVKFDGFLNQDSDLFSGIGGRNATRQVGYVCTKAARSLFDDNQVLHIRPHFFKPACFRMLLKVPGGTSTLGLPATVTVPALDA